MLRVVDELPFKLRIPYESATLKTSKTNLLTPNIKGQTSSQRHTRAVFFFITMPNPPKVHDCFEPKTNTWQYVVADPSTREAVIIDSVLDYDPSSNTFSTETADSLLDLIDQHHYGVSHILETHVHADHPTAAHYLQEKLKQRGQTEAKICTGKRIHLIQIAVAARYGIDPAELENAFDHLFDDDEQFLIGNINAHVLHLPGHTPDHIGYVIGENVFTGDSIFNPDVGSARCDFPGGSAHELYNSMQKLLSFPSHYRLYTGHDYPPDGRDVSEHGQKWKAYTTVQEQKSTNKHVKQGTTKEDFVKWRTDRDEGLAEPRLLHQSLQINIRGGHLPKPTQEGYRFINVPIKVGKTM